MMYKAQMKAGLNCFDVDVKQDILIASLYITTFQPKSLS